MKNYVITIDTGTTNTRTFLWDENRNMIASASASVGVHDTAIEGNNARLKKRSMTVLKVFWNRAASDMMTSTK